MNWKNCLMFVCLSATILALAFIHASGSQALSGQSVSKALEAYSETWDPTVRFVMETLSKEITLNRTIPPTSGMIGYAYLGNLTGYKTITLAVRAEGPATYSDTIRVSFAFGFTSTRGVIKFADWNVPVHLPDPIFPTLFECWTQRSIAGPELCWSWSNPNSYSVTVYIAIYLTSP